MCIITLLVIIIPVSCELNATTFYIKNETKLLKGNLVTTINRLFKEFTVSFEVKLTADHDPYSVPLNLFHLTTNDNYGAYGSRTPAMWIHNGNFQISSAVNGYSDYNIKVKVFEPGNWNSFKISQQLFNGTYLFLIEHNCTSICHEQNYDSKEFLNVKVYISNPWDDTQPGLIRNFKVTNGKQDQAELWSQWGSWSVCDNTNGYTYRMRECNASNTFDCCGKDRDIKECYVSSTFKCLYGWLENANNCYLIQKNQLTYQNSLASCESYGGSLVSVEDQAEYDFILKYINQSNIGSTYVWIGLNDLKNKAQRKFEWSDLTPVTYTNWRGGQPDNYGGNEDCVHIRYDDSKWHDITCEYKFAYICKHKRGSDLLNVSSIVTVNGNLVTLNVQIYPNFQIPPIVKNVSMDFEYFLSPFLSLVSNSVIQGFVKVDANPLKYAFSGIFTSSDAFNYNFTASFNDSTCPMSGTMMLEIPFIMSLQVDFGKRMQFTKTTQKRVHCFNTPKITFVKDKQVLEESYGRGIYWDADNSHIYLCMNQHVPREINACYYSNNNGELWDNLDVRIGSIIGHHLITKELYGIHRNRKLYMFYHKKQKKWLAMTNQQFKVTSNFNNRMFKSLDGDYDQIINLATNQWLGNNEGLFFRSQLNDSWIKRVNWRFYKR